MEDRNFVKKKKEEVKDSCFYSVKRDRDLVSGWDKIGEDMAIFW